MPTRTRGVYKQWSRATCEAFALRSARGSACALRERGVVKSGTGSLTESGPRASRNKFRHSMLGSSIRKLAAPESCRKSDASSQQNKSVYNAHQLKEITCY
jgi:hypothetical protein